MKIHSLLSILLLMLLTVGCATRDPFDNAAATAPTAIPSSPIATTPIAALPAASPTPTSVPPTVTAAPLQIPDGAPVIRFIDEVESVTSYRLGFRQHSLMPNVDGSGGGVLVRVAKVKAPEAMMISVTDLSYGETHTYRMVEDKYYHLYEQKWHEDPEEEMIFVEDVFPFTEAELQSVVGAMEIVDDEAVQGRMATHYHGTKESVAPLVMSQGYQVENIDTLTLDIWIDQELQFVSKIEMELSGSNLTVDAYKPEETVEQTISVEYYSLNDTITLTAPNAAGMITEAAVLTPDSIIDIRSYRFIESAWSGMPNRDDLEGAPVESQWVVTGTISLESDSAHYESLYQDPTMDINEDREMRSVEGIGYLFADETWTEVGEMDTGTLHAIMTRESIYPTGVDEIERALATMTMVGDDEVRGRAAVHYQGDSATLGELIELEDGNVWASLPLSNIEAQVDIWIDDEYGYVSKIEITFDYLTQYSSQPFRNRLSREYFDINVPVTIEAPLVDSVE